ncbi:uncharacterized protein [Venturia canescens]|uniref:uncharacterized protein n=1 Tax=Venturia canescens TaxID=32260 RepID=UPI001C9D417A|nr:uncharacterized protein LOC122406480 [Venturia canescens]
MQNFGCTMQRPTVAVRDSMGSEIESSASLLHGRTNHPCHKGRCSFTFNFQQRPNFGYEAVAAIHFIKHGIKGKEEVEKAVVMSTENKVSDECGKGGALIAANLSTRWTPRNFSLRAVRRSSRERVFFN